jgi:hypothetical protein
VYVGNVRFNVQVNVCDFAKAQYSETCGAVTHDPRAIWHQPRIWFENYKSGAGHTFMSAMPEVYAPEEGRYNGSLIAIPAPVNEEQEGVFPINGYFKRDLDEVGPMSLPVGYSALSWIRPYWGFGGEISRVPGITDAVTPCPVNYKVFRGPTKYLDPVSKTWQYEQNLGHFGGMLRPGCKAWLTTGQKDPKSS